MGQRWKCVEAVVAFFLALLDCIVLWALVPFLAVVAALCKHLRPLSALGWFRFWIRFWVSLVVACEGGLVRGTAGLAIAHTQIDESFEGFVLVFFLHWDHGDGDVPETGGIDRYVMV